MQAHQGQAASPIDKFGSGFQTPLCKDSGGNAVAAQANLFGRTAVMRDCNKCVNAPCTNAVIKSDSLTSGAMRDQTHRGATKEKGKHYGIAKNTALGMTAGSHMLVTTGK
jgi:hypothetical protein